VIRKTRARALWLVITLLLAGCGAGTPVGPRSRVHIGTSPSFPPFETLPDDQESFIGFDIDLMRAIAAKTNLEVVYTSVPYKALLTGIADCTYDGGIAAITMDDTLKAQMSFSDPYFSVGQVIVVKQGNPRITGRETLAGQKVGVQMDTPAAREVARIAGVQALPYPAVNQAFADLIAGLIDAVVIDNTVAQSYTSVRANNLKVAGGAIAYSSYRIAICSQRADLLQRINAGLATVQADGTLERLRRQWILGDGR
jgi:polar amino acid transport system substrate-binding protein